MQRLQTSELVDLAALEKLAPEWEELWQRSPNATPFQRPQWLVPYARVFGPPALWGIEVRDGGRLVGFAPLALESQGGERVVSPLGLGVSDYQDLLLDTECSSDALRAILRHLEEQSARWDAIRFPDLRQTSLLLQADLPEGWQRARSPREACPVLELAGAAETVDQAASTRLLARLRNARRRLEREGTLHFEVATAESLPAALEVFFTLHGARWKSLGGRGVLADASVRSFHRLAAPGLLARGVLRLYTLRLDERPLAALYALFEPSVAYLYLQGFDPAFGTYSPGGLILEQVLRDAAGEGKRAADFLRGREAYKYKWGARDRPTFSLQIRTRASAQRERQPGFSRGLAG